MCGIAGIFKIDGLDDAFGRQLLIRMNRFQAHRGPDGEGFFMEGPCGLAHRRLAIIDEEGGAQPMFSSDGRYVLIYNGEVYNYLALRAELVELGHSFISESDSEVVLEAFAEWGPSCFDRFNGMWGIAIYDRVEQRLTLCRDHFGIKPLYYALLPGADGSFDNNDSTGFGGLIFSSEIKPIAFSGLVERRPNDRTVYRYLRFRVHDDEADTFFAGISQLTAGQMLQADAQGVRVSSYTTLIDDLRASALASGPDAHIAYSPAATERFLDELHESVRLRLQSDFPVGTALSGGLDSTSVAALINELMEHDKASSNAVGKMQNVFSAVFPNSINDEEQYIDAFVRDHADTVAVHKIIPKAEEFVADFYDFIYTQEMPIISTGPYAQYQVMRMASQTVKVLLDGQGADEMMAGYVPYYFVYLQQLLRRGHYLRFLRESLSSVDKIGRLLWVRFASRLKGKKAWDERSLIDAAFAARFAGERLDVVRDNIKLRLVNDLFLHSIPCILRYEDRNTMRFSLEGRLPFLDKNLVRYVWSVADEAIIKGSWNKRIMRDAMLPYLPKEISARRNKVGFTTPEVEWFGLLKDVFLEIFESESFASRSYFAVDEARRAYRAYYDGTGDATTLVFWRMINIEIWMRTFIDAPLPPTPEEPPHPRGRAKRDMLDPAPPIRV